MEENGETATGKRERYEPGTFCWVDLMTNDSAGAKTFYDELFGWGGRRHAGGRVGNVHDAALER